MPPETASSCDVIRGYLQQEDHQALESFIESLSPKETMWAISHLSDEDRHRLICLLSPEEAAELIHDLPSAQVADLLEDIQPAAAAAIVEQMHSDQRADVLEDVEKHHADAILDALPLQTATDTLALMAYSPDTAGGIMVTEYLAYPESWTLSHLIVDLRRNREQYADYQVQYIYVVDDDRRLQGVLPLRDVLLRPAQDLLRHVMIPRPLSVVVTTSLDKLIQVFGQSHFMGVPVVDEEGRLLGIVERASVSNAEGARSDNMFLKFSGIMTGEELRSMSLWRRIGGRLAWLTVNICLNVVAVSVIAVHQDTLAAAIALAIFMPIISDMSGCAGNQSVAVSIRELVLGLIKPNEWLRIFRKEVIVGVLNGLFLGFVLFIVAWGWRGNVWLGLVVGGALGINILVGSLVGGLLPLFIKRIHADPALASSPMLTTITDICGFFLTLTFAAMVLPRLTP